MTPRWVACLWLIACASPPAPGVTSGGGATTETAAETAGESAPFDEAETASALGDPPAPAPEVQTTEATHDSVVSAVSPSATETSAAQPATVRPTIILAPARSGRVRLADVHEVIRTHQPDVSRCYEEGLSRDRSLSGEAKVRFLIGPQGRIESAEVYETTLSDEVVEACILATMGDWRFPRPRPRGSSVLMTYPYSFATE